LTSEISGDCFGIKVSLSDEYAIVGDHSLDTPLSNSGAAYVFKRTENQWIAIKKLTASDAEVNDSFGIDVTMDNGYVMVGAYQDDDTATNSGAVYVYPIVTKSSVNIN
jgi:hypothetical protein